MRTLRLLCLGLALTLALTGCSLFERPSPGPNAPTIANGEYHSKAERWAAESQAAAQRATNEQLEHDLAKAK